MATPKDVNANGDQLRRILHSDIVTLKVGPQEKLFRVHKDLITSRSEFFKTAFNGHTWQEANTNIMTLEDSNETVVNVVVAWIYTGRLRYIPENEETAQQSALFSVGHSKNCCSKDRSEVDFEQPYTWCAYVHLGIYTFADRYLLPSIKREILVVISDCDFPVDDVDLLKMIWSSSPGITGLKKLVLDLLIFDECGFLDNEHVAKELPHDFLVEIIRRTRKRLPPRQCEACATKPPRQGQVKSRYDGATVRYGKEVAPFDNDMCIYHDHVDDAERALCKAEEAAKKKPKVQ